MDESLLLLGVLFFAVVAVVALVLYVTLRAKFDRRVKEEFVEWRDREISQVAAQERETARREALVELEEWKATETKQIRKDAIQRSQAVTLGKITEHLFPYLSQFPYNPKDARFLGSPVDFVVFNGLNEGSVESIAFVEVKTGDSDLSTRERRVRDAVQSGNVVWRELRYEIEQHQTADNGDDDTAFAPPV